jgi:FkbM family methyltransferase
VAIVAVLEPHEAGRSARTEPSNARGAAAYAEAVKRVVLTALLLPACSSPERPPLRASIDLAEVLSLELLDEANKGRRVVEPDGRFVIPPDVDRVWVDVGAHRLETTRRPLTRLGGLMVIGIEPLEERWREWPDHPNLIALPVAIADERGWLEFKVAASTAASSLLKGSVDDEVLGTVELRQVPVLRLEDVLERIPPDVEVEYVKTDVQGLDLEVLRSAGEQLRRVTFVRTEVILYDAYVPEGERGPATEAEYLDYMQQMGFRFMGDLGVEPTGRWLDKTFVNERDDAWDRLRRWLRQLPSVTETDPF